MPEPQQLQRRTMLHVVGIGLSSLLMVRAARMIATVDPRPADLLGRALEGEQRAAWLHRRLGASPDPVIARRATQMIPGKAEAAARLAGLIGVTVRIPTTIPGTAPRADDLPHALRVEAELAALYRELVPVTVSPLLSANLATAVYHLATLRALLVRAAYRRGPHALMPAPPVARVRAPG